MSKTLRYFIVTAQEESIQSAASKLFITSSPLCRTIKTFEDSIGRKLFFRTKNGLILTPYGHELYHKLIPIYKEAFFIEESYSQKNANSIKCIKDFKIGVDHQEHSYIYSTLSSNFLKESKFDISIDYFPPYDINIDSILSGNSYILFFSFNELSHSQDIIHLKLPTDTYNLAASSKNTIPRATLKEYLSFYTLVYYQHQPSEPGWSSVDNYLKKNEITPRKIRVPNISDQLSMIENCDAVGIVTNSAKNIISERCHDINLFKLMPDEDEIKITRHIYFSSKNKQLVEKYALNYVD